MRLLTNVGGFVLTSTLTTADGMLEVLNKRVDGYVLAMHIRS